MGEVTRFAPELRERAVRLLWEHEKEYPSRWAAVKSIAEKVGCSAETLRSCVGQAERDTGKQTGPATDDLRRKSGWLRPKPVPPASCRLGR